MPTDSTAFPGVEELRTQLSRLAELLVAAATELDEAGRLPDASLDEALRNARDAFERARSGIEHELKKFEDSTQHGKSNSPLLTLEDLLELSQQLARARDRASEACAAALCTLERISNLTSPRASILTTLAICKAEAQSMILAIRSGDDGAREITKQLVDGTTHYSALLELVENGDNISAARAKELQDAISASWGPDLAWAAARGLVTFEVQSAEDAEVGAEAEEHPTTLVAASAETSTTFGAATTSEPHPKDVTNESSQQSGVGRPTNRQGERRLIGMAKPDAARKLQGAVDSVLRARADFATPVTPDDAARETTATTSLISAMQATEMSQNVQGVAPSDEQNRPERPASTSQPPASADTGTMQPSRDTAGSTAPNSAAPTSRAREEQHVRPGVRKAEIFNSESTAAQIAMAIRDRVVSASEGLVALAWRLIGDGRAAIAYHALSGMPASAEDCGGSLPPHLAACLAIAPFTHHNEPSSAEALAPQYHHLHEHLERLRNSRTEDREPQCVLLLLASIRPALLSPGTGAAAVLQQIPVSETMQSLFELRQAVLAYSQLGLELSAGILKGVRDHAKWLESMAEHRRQARHWLEQNRQATIKYAPATDVWRHWLRDDGPLGFMLNAVIADQRHQLAKIRLDIANWNDEAHVRQQIVHTDVRIRGRKADLRPIDASARTALIKHAKQSLTWSRQWITLVDQEPQSLSDFRYRQADECRSKIVVGLRRASDQLREWQSSNSRSLEVAAARACAHQLLRDLNAVFDPATEDNPRILSASQVLNAELLRYPELGLSTEWEPLDAPNTILSSVIAGCADGELSWQDAFRARCERCEHTGTNLMLDHLRVIGEPEEVLAELHTQRQESLAQCRSALRRNADDAMRQIERAASYDLLAASDLSRLVEMVQTVTLPDICDFAPANATLDKVRVEITQKRNERLDQLRKRLSELETIHADLRELVEQALAAGDFIRASEYLDAASEGKSPPQQPPASDDFTHFFPGFVHDALHFLEESHGGLRDYIEDIEQCRRVGPLEMGQVPGAQAQSAARMVEAWLRLKGRRGSTGQAVRQLFESFGFNVNEATELESPPTARFSWYRLSTEQLVDRAESVLPHFGSVARGRYSVLCVWDRPSEEELIQLTSRRSPDEKIIVLYMGRMTEQRRRELAFQCRQRRKTLLVIDELNVFHLCGVRGHRLPVLMRCCLPFTVTDPYTTTAGLVPHEMFFGRERERDSIIRAEGTNLVYGGRQLGKTALLRDVERRFHQPTHGMIVKWIDLRSEGIGETRPTDDIWLVLAEALLTHGVISHPARQPDTLHKRIAEWLSSDPMRRIVLLLDEADAFLESDGKAGPQSYPNVKSLKGMIDATNRRFKVVFAGLHNVQRTSRDVNTPIAHLGDPICIGPLLDGEAREAMGLVTIPFEALGYRFEPPDLPLRILSHTNYYPSLIQLFCKHLLEHLTDPHNLLFDVRSSPPFVITEQHLEEAYQSQKLRKAILHRFNLTLDLDPRYRLIALCIASEVAKRLAEGGSPRGFSAAWVRDEVLWLWPAGFQNDSSEEALRNILEEMIGLGVLRVVDDGRLYTLRSPNILNLLGTRAEVDDALLAANDRPPPPAYERSQFRRAQPHDAWTRSPLTAQQESALLGKSSGVTVLVGSLLAVLARTSEFLEICSREFPQEVRLETLEPRADLARFGCQLEAVWRARERGLTLLVVPHDCVWGEDWVRSARAFLMPKRSVAKAMRVVFIGGPRAAWDCMRARKLDPGSWSGELNELTLAPWAEPMVQRWMNDTELGSHLDLTARKQICLRTGRWGYLLHKFADRCRQTPHSWEKHLAAVPDDLRKLRPEWREELVDHAVPAFTALAEWDALSTQDLQDCLRGTTAMSWLDDVLRWAELMSFATCERAASDQANWKWRLDPVVAQLLQDPERSAFLPTPHSGSKE